MSTSSALVSPPTAIIIGVDRHKHVHVARRACRDRSLANHEDRSLNRRVESMPKGTPTVQ